MSNINFAFEDLEVWKKSVDFADEVIHLIDKNIASRKHFRLVEQLEAAVISVALNIAEGKGRQSKKEFIQFLYIARGSLFETVTLLTIFQNNNWITQEEMEALKRHAFEIAKMLSSFISFIKRSIS